MNDQGDENGPIIEDLDDDMPKKEVVGKYTEWAVENATDYEFGEFELGQGCSIGKPFTLSFEDE